MEIVIYPLVPLPGTLLGAPARPLLYAWVDTLVALADEQAGTPSTAPTAGIRRSALRGRGEAITTGSRPVRLGVDPAQCGYGRGEGLDPLYSWPMWHEVLVPALETEGFPRDLIEEAVSPVNYHEAASTAFDTAGVEHYIRNVLDPALREAVRNFVAPAIDDYLATWTTLPEQDTLSWAPEPGWEVVVPAAAALSAPVIDDREQRAGD